jgi:hypothetical protein
MLRLIVVDKDLSLGEAAEQSGFGGRLKKTANAAGGLLEKCAECAFFNRVVLNGLFFQQPGFSMDFVFNSQLEGDTLNSHCEYSKMRV